MSSTPNRRLEPEHYAKVKKVFRKVCDLDPTSRETVLGRWDAKNPDVSGDVRRLLKHHDPVQALAEAASPAIAEASLPQISIDGARKVFPWLEVHGGNGRNVGAQAGKGFFGWLKGMRIRLGATPTFLATLVVFVVFVFAAFAELNRQLLEARMAELEHTADSFEQAVQYGVDSKIDYLQQLLESRHIADSIAFLLDKSEKIRAGGGEVEGGGGISANQLLLKRHLQAKNHAGLQFILRDRIGRVVAFELNQSMQDRLPMLDDPVDMHDLMHVMDGRPKLHLPHMRRSSEGNAARRREAHSDAKAILDKTDVWILIPILDKSGSVNGVISFWDEHSQSDLQSACAQMAFAKSGELIPFTEDGIALGPTRFDNELRLAGMLASGLPSAALSYRLTNPGAEITRGQPAIGLPETRPLIESVAEVVPKHVVSDSGGNVEDDGEVDDERVFTQVTHSGGDRIRFKRPKKARSKISVDYRGVPCISTSRWAADLGFGFVVKQDLSEAMRPSKTSSRFLVSGLVVVLGGLVAVQGIAIFRRCKHRVCEGDWVGPYRVLEKISEGATGVVYKAEHRMLGRMAAVKLLKPQLMDPGSLARFDREARMVAMMRSKHTICVYDYGTSDRGEPYFAMELLSGVGLDVLVVGRGRFDPWKTLAHLREIAEPLREAHGMGMVHGDLKPQNLIMTQRDAVPESLVLIDFGLAKCWASPPSESTARSPENASGPSIAISGESKRCWMGTPMFMAPERIRDPFCVDPRSDIFSLGAVGYFMLTGAFPFEGETPERIFSRILRGDFAFFDQAKELAAGNKAFAMVLDLVVKCMDADAAKRPESIDQFLDLAQCLPSCLPRCIPQSSPPWASSLGG